MDAPAPASPEVWWIRGEGGDVIPFQLPLPEGIPARLRTGALLRVNEDGTPWDGEQPPPGPPTTFAEFAADKAEKAEDDDRPTLLPVPPKNAPKAAWVAHAWSTGTIAKAAAEDLSKDELIVRFGRRD